MKNHPLIPLHRQAITALLRTSLLTVGSISVTSALASSDYGPAIWNPPSGCTKYYSSGYGHHFVVIHDMEGYYLSSVSYLRTCGVSASVNYAVNGKQDTSTDAPAGEITEMVAEANYAWHVSCWNLWMVGTEHEGFASNPAWYTDAMYNATGPLQKHLAEHYGIPKDRNHIIAHGEWQNQNWKNWMAANYGSINTSCNTHTDPGPYWNWSRLMSSLNPFSNGHINPAVVRNSDGHMEVFAVGKTGSLYHSYWGGSGWTSWASIGGFTFAANTLPAVQRNSDGRLQLFIIGGDGKVDYIYQQTAGDSTSWSGWNQIAGYTFSQQASVVANTNLDGRIEVLIVGKDGQLDHVWENTAGNSTSWSSWGQLGGSWDQNVSLSGGNDADGRQEVFAIGNTGNLYHINQTVANGGWSGWGNLGGSWPQTQRTALASNSDGRLEIFIIGNDGTIHHAYQTSPNGSWYTAWPSLGSWVYSSNAKPVAGLNSDGTLELLAIGTDGHLNHINSANGWAGGWSSLPSSPAFSQDIRPCLGVNSDGRLEVFLTAPSSDLVHAYETTPSGSWYGWPTLGGSWN